MLRARVCREKVTAQIKVARYKAANPGNGDGPEKGDSPGKGDSPEKGDSPGKGDRPFSKSGCYPVMIDKPERVYPFFSEQAAIGMRDGRKRIGE